MRIQMIPAAQLSRLAAPHYNSRVAGSVDPSLDSLLGDVLGRHDPTSWTREVLASVATETSFDRIVVPYTAAQRRLRGVALQLGEEESSALHAMGAEALAARGAAALFRALLLLTACGGSAAERRVEIVDRLFRTGDNDERIDLLVTLPFLPTPADFADTAVEACRTNVRDVFAAIACDNDFPSRWFSDAAFNQMVMKALFSSVDLSRIRGLKLRVNPELRRMAADYAAERRAANRSVPSDIARYLEGAQP
jgi:hypothetical protein